MRMSRFITVILLMLLVYPHCGEVFGKAQYFKGKKYDELAEKGLEYAAYNPQGESPDGRAVYIYGGAMCGYTQRIMKAQDKLRQLIDKGIQIRWIFPHDSEFNPEPVLYLVNERLPEAFNDFFGRIGKEATREQRTIASVNKVLALVSDNIGGYPSISYKTAKGIKYTNSIDDVLADADEIAPVNDKNSKTRKYAAEIMEMNLENPVKVKNRTKQIMRSYSLPDKDSPIMSSKVKGLFQLKPGQTSSDECYDLNDEFFACKFVAAQEGYFYFYPKN